jgi:hypothetical protein
MEQVAINGLLNSSSSLLEADNEIELLAIEVRRSKEEY